MIIFVGNLRAGCRRLPARGGARLLGALTLVILLLGGSAAAARRLPGYHSPGYAGTIKLPHVIAVPPPKPVFVSTNGHSAHVLVDAAGTAHLTWSQDPDQTPGILHYCRFPRGASACTGSYEREILQPATGGNGPATDVDFEGPFPLSVGNELLLLDSRCCNAANAPDGMTTDNPDYLFTSEDGGTSFSGPDDPNGSAGIIGNTAPSGNVIVFNGNSPEIGIITDTVTGGTFFQGVPSGQFTRHRANLSTRPDQEDAIDGRLAVDGIRPVASFSDLDGTTYVREWNGQGSVNDEANWSLLKLPGAYKPRIAGGGSGLLLLTQTRAGMLQVRRLAPGAGSAGPPTSLGPADGNYNEIAEDASGHAAVARVDSAGTVPTIDVHTSSDGRHWTNLGAVTRVPGGQLNNLGVGVTVDGGGFVTFRDTNGAHSTFEGRIGIAQFGPATATGQPGLGLLPGRAGPPGGDPAASVACTKVHFDDIDALSTAGCFLRDPSNPTSGAAVTSGSLRLNGVDIIPDPGVKIAIDPRFRTINTTGAVQVQLNTPGLGPITIWHMPLHVQLTTGRTGETLFDFDTSQFAASLEGFPFDGHIQVILRHDAVDIPVHLALPPYFGGINGDADLSANNTDGLVFKSLHLGIDDANIGVLELKHVHLDYSRQGSLWDGGAEVLLPGPLSPDIAADVTFENGSFKHGQFKVGFTPGIPVFEDVYLHEFRLGFGLHPTEIEGGVSVGVYDGLGGYPLDIDGNAKIQVGDAGNPTIVFVGGTGRVLGFGLAHASFTYNSDGYVLFHIDAKLDADVASVKAAGDVFVLHGDFGANLDVTGCISTFCGGFDGAASPKGLSVCSDPFGADVPDWNIGRIKVHIFGCDVSPYQLQAPPPGGARDQPRGAYARSAAAGDRTFAVAAGQRAVDLDLTGVGGAPSVVLISPSGQTYAPASKNFQTAKVLAVSSRSGSETFVGVRTPTPGLWTVRPQPGSPAIASLATAHPVLLPAIGAKVIGRGPLRALRYTIRGATPGTLVQFAEKGKEGMTPLGKPVHSSGVLRFAPAPGIGGRRRVIAVVTQDGYTRAQPVVATFSAPGLGTPGRVPGLRVTRRGGNVSVSFRTARGALRYLVRVSATGGLSTQRTTSSHTVTLRGVRRGAMIRVFVRGANVRGKLGPVVTRTVAAARRPARAPARRKRR